MIPLSLIPAPDPLWSGIPLKQKVTDFLKLEDVPDFMEMPLIMADESGKTRFNMVASSTLTVKFVLVYGIAFSLVSSSKSLTALPAAKDV